MEFLKFIKWNSNKLVRALGFLLPVTVVLCLSVAAQTVKRVKFVYGESSVVLSAEVRIGQKDTYIIRLKKEQNIQIVIELDGEDITNEPRPIWGYTIIFPKSKKLINPPIENLQTRAVGDYKIFVSPMAASINSFYGNLLTGFATQ